MTILEYPASANHIPTPIQIEITKKTINGPFVLMDEPFAFLASG